MRNHTQTTRCDHYQVLMLVLIQHGCLLPRWCSVEGKALFPVTIPYLSLHLNAFISLPTYFISSMCSPSLPPVLSFFLSFFSPQIIANHHMQSISFASGGDPVSCSTLCLSLSLSSDLTLAFFPFFFRLHVLSCLKSSFVPLNFTYFIAAFLTCSSCSPHFLPSNLRLTYYFCFLVFFTCYFFEATAPALATFQLFES